MVPLAWSLFCAPPALAADGEPAASGAEIALVLELRSGETRAREARALKVGALLMAGALGAEDQEAYERLGVQLDELTAELSYGY